MYVLVEAVMTAAITNVNGYYRRSMDCWIFKSLNINEFMIYSYCINFPC